MPDIQADPRTRDKGGNEKGLPRRNGSKLWQHEWGGSLVPVVFNPGWQGKLTGDRVPCVWLAVDGIVGNRLPSENGKGGLGEARLDLGMLPVFPRVRNIHHSEKRATPQGELAEVRDGVRMRGKFRECSILIVSDNSQHVVGVSLGKQFSIMRCPG